MAHEPRVASGAPKCARRAYEGGRGKEPDETTELKSRIRQPLATAADASQASVTSARRSPLSTMAIALTVGYKNLGFDPRVTVLLNALHTA